MSLRLDDLVCPIRWNTFSSVSRDAVIIDHRSIANLNTSIELVSSPSIGDGHQAGPAQEHTALHTLKGSFCPYRLELSFRIRLCTYMHHLNQVCDHESCMLKHRVSESRCGFFVAHRGLSNSVPSETHVNLCHSLSAMVSLTRERERDDSSEPTHTPVKV